MVRTRTSVVCRLLALAVVAAGFGLAARPASALSINLSYINTANEPPPDPTGSRLQSLMAEAAAQWESIILDSHSVTVRFGYGSGDWLGVSYVDDDSGGRTTVATIIINY